MEDEFPGQRSAKNTPCCQNSTATEVHGHLGDRRTVTGCRAEAGLWWAWAEDQSFLLSCSPCSLSHFCFLSVGDAQVL